jgi:hypothetical protein
MAEEKPQPQDKHLERQGVVTDAINAFATGLGAGAGGVGAAKLIDAISTDPPKEPKPQVELPPGVEKPSGD